MDRFSRLRTLIVAAGCVAISSSMFAAEPALNAHALLVHASQGYLGVAVSDVDSDRAAALKLKGAEGAEVIRIDQDAPAAKAGIKVHDVVVQMNGQQIEGVEQLRRMLRETPAGRTVAFVLERDGQPVNVSVQLADRLTLAKNSLDGMVPVPEPGDPPAEVWMDSQPMFGGSFPGRGSSFFGTSTKNPLYVGLAVHPLTTQLADYFGVKDGTGLLVDSVFENSPASTAGLKAADVILKVNGQAVASIADFQRSIRNNRGKQVQVTVMRNKKEQTLTMTAGEAKTKGEIDVPDAQVLVADAQRHLAGIDVNAIAEQARQAAKDIDVKAIQEQASQSANVAKLQQELKAAGAIDTKKLQQELKDSQAQRAADMAKLEQELKTDGTFDKQKLQSEIEHSQQRIQQQMDAIRKAMDEMQTAPMD